MLACRNNERGKKAETSINAQSKSNAIFNGGKAEFMKCDLANLESTKAFIQNYKSKKYPLHLLINNGGLAGRPKLKFTKDGFNMIWQINYLSHFLITHQLLPLMIASSNDQSFDCRIINTSSFWHQHGHVDIETLTSDQSVQKKKFQGSTGNYGTSKLAQIMHATYLQTEVFNRCNIPITICSVHPGGVRTNIFKTDKWSMPMKLGLYFFYFAWYFGLRSSEQGSRNSIYCAVAPIGDHQKKWGGTLVPGAYHVNMRPSITLDKGGQSTDPKEMRKLYAYSLEALGLYKRTKEDYEAMMEEEGIAEGIESLKDGIIAMTDKEYWFHSITESKWTKVSDLGKKQRCFDHPSIVFHDDTIYRIGGRNIESDQCMKACEYLRLGSNNKKCVTMSGRLNERRCSVSAIFLDEHLLAIGGDDNGDELASMEEYDFDSTKWNLRASMNETRNDFGVCSLSKSELLVIGGHSVDRESGISGYLDSIERYDYDADEWTLLNTNLPFGKRARCGAFHWKEYNANTVVVAGGTSPCRDIVECLDLEKMKWTQLPNLRKCHWWPQIGTLSTESPQILYVVGLNEKYELDVVEYLDVRENAKKWNTQNIIQTSGLRKVNALCWT